MPSNFQWYHQYCLSVAIAIAEELANTVLGSLMGTQAFAASLVALFAED